MANIKGIMSYDNEIGTLTKPPRLTSVTEYSMWKLRFKSFLMYDNYTLWNSIENGPHRPEVLEAGSTNRMIPKPTERYSEEDLKLVERDHRAYGAITMALPNEIFHNFKDCKTAKELWDAIELRYEGSLELRESKKDMLKRQFELFEWCKGESLTEQINRFTLLISDMKTLNIQLRDADVCKKLLSSLPSKWNVQVMVIKRTANLNSMSLEELIGVLQSYEIDMKPEDRNERDYGNALLSSHQPNEIQSSHHSCCSKPSSEFVQERLSDCVFSSSSDCHSSSSEFVKIPQKLVLTSQTVP